MNTLTEKQITRIFSKDPYGPYWFSGVKFSGEYINLHNNGKLYAHCFFKDGKRDGEYKSWGTDGMLRHVEIYKVGEVKSTIVMNGIIYDKNYEFIDDYKDIKLIV
jgi:antitoxin component YwqK of YwqJK toxin-antitoxin module